MKMLKGKVLFVLVVGLVGTTSQVFAWHGAGKFTKAEKIYIRQALLGDLSSLEKAVENVEGAEQVLAKFKEKFENNEHGIDLGRIQEPLIRQIMVLHIDYWRQALIFPKKLDRIEDEFKSKMLDLANSSSLFKGPLDEEGMQQVMLDYIKKQGYGALLLDKTPPLLEFMLWQKNEDHEYTVELTDTTETVKVTHVGDFISFGWSNYATHGVAGTGGWATKEQLYCVCETYDQKSEKFLTSYLKHEARHFADYKKYPSLQSASLEYRAKLTELSFAETTIHWLLDRFASDAVGETEVGHSLANWHVIEDLKNELKLVVGDKNSVDWRKVPVNQIQQAARKLLKQNDEKMAKLGVNTTENTIFPVIR